VCDSEQNTICFPLNPKKPKEDGVCICSSGHGFNYEINTRNGHIYHNKPIRPKDLATDEIVANFSALFKKKCVQFAVRDQTCGPPLYAPDEYWPPEVYLATEEMFPNPTRNLQNSGIVPFHY